MQLKSKAARAWKRVSAVRGNGECAFKPMCACGTCRQVCRYAFLWLTFTWKACCVDQTTCLKTITAQTWCSSGLYKECFLLHALPDKIADAKEPTCIHIVMHFLSQYSQTLQSSWDWVYYVLIYLSNCRCHVFGVTRIAQRYDGCLVRNGHKPNKSLYLG
jgi:hypothetical protein